MKNTIRNTVSEVYKQVNNNFSFNKDLLNFNNNSNISSIKSNSNSNNYINTNSNKKRAINKNADILSQNYSKTTNSGYTIMIFFLILLFVGGLIIFFKDKISEIVKKLFKDEESENKIKELESSMNEKNSLNSELQKELEKLKKESESQKNKDSEKQTNTNKKKLSKNDVRELAQTYSPSQIVSNDGYCFIGMDDNMRHCVKAYAGDVCQSGDIYNRIDECLVPNN